ncbi:MAG: DUF1939 domain-containing protein [Pseudarcicella sp.]|nr:DUF1939 domain-containing protein [Pseudarcicella sp.]
MKNSNNHLLRKNINLISCFHKLKTTYLSALIGLSSLGFFASCEKNQANPNENPITSSQSKTAAVISAPVNGVMMQGFYWDVPQNTPSGSWWQNLGAKAAELSDAGITAMWIPPCYKGGSATDVGYGVYDRYDLGEFNQKGTIPTRYGTLAQLQSAITNLHSKNIQVYADIVINHMAWADYTENFNGTNVYTGFSFPGRGNTYSSYKWNKNLFTGYQGAGGVWYQFSPWDFQPYNNGDAYDNLLGCEIKYNNSPSNETETIAWGNWITNKLGLDGYRMDAVKHIYTPYLNKFTDNVKGSRFMVGENWSNSVSALQNYAQETNGRMSLMDVPLHYTFQQMSIGNGSWDMRGLQFAGFTEANGPLSVSFVDNHDTDHQTGALFSPVINHKMLAYAYILTREKGYPCVYYRDYYEYGLGSKIKTLMKCRKENAFGVGAEYPSVNDADVYCYSRAGDATHKGMLVMLNDGSNNATKGITTPFKNATLTDKTGNTSGTISTNANGYAVFPVNARNYAVWTPDAGTVVVVPTTTTNVTFNISYSNTQPGQDLYIVGNVAALGSWNAANAVKLTTNPWPNWTKTLALPTGTNIEYKYIRKDASGNVLWQGGANKVFTPTGASQVRNDTW